MRRAARLVPAPVLALLLAAPLAPAVAAPAAGADDAPSAGEVAAAQDTVRQRRGDVAALEAALADAGARQAAADLAAAQAAESYNGAMWRLQRARDAVRRSADEQAEAEADVERQRSGIVSLVTESYQNGADLTAATALLTDDGFTGVMNRQAVVESAGESMDVTFDRFRAAQHRAEDATARARDSARDQQRMAAEAERLAAGAAGAAQAAADATAQVASRRTTLIAELARAQQVSVALATRRQEALERAARARAAAAEEARQEAAAQAAAQAAQQAAAAQAAADEAAADKAASEQAAQQPRPRRRTPAPDPAPAPAQVPAPAPVPAPSGSDVQRAIAYAYAQVGKPYRWAASGPDSFDCSGLTMQAWARGGRSLPHYSVAQFSAGTPVPVSEARAGDLLFWSTNGSASGIHHVALALGGGRYIEAPRTGLDVRVSSYAYWYPTHAVRL